MERSELQCRIISFRPVASKLMLSYWDQAVPWQFASLFRSSFQVRYAFPLFALEFALFTFDIFTEEWKNSLLSQ
jgi:hypothetical protein